MPEAALCNVKIVLNRISEEKLVHNRSLMNNYRLNHHLLFYEYLNDVKGFSPYASELKNYMFRFKRTHIDHAQKRLEHSLGVSIPFSNNNETANKIVSIHVRLGDYEKHLKRVFDLPMVPDDYFTRAMNLIIEINSVSL